MPARKRRVAMSLAIRAGGGPSSGANPRTYLYEVSYRGKLLADIIRELIPIFQAYEPGLKAAHDLRKNMQAEEILRRPAEELGYDLV